MTSVLRTGSGRQLRSPALHEQTLPLPFDAQSLTGSRILGSDGQVYESMKDWVTGLYEWKVRAQGEPGPRVDLQRSSTHLQWRVEGNTGPWTDLVALSELQGPQGEQGDQGEVGPQGAGLSYQGSVATVANLPIPSTQGYAYLVASTGHLWIYGDSAWADAGQIQGPPGESGSSVEIRKTATEIQWRLQGASEWLPLVQLQEIKGDAGSNVEIRKTATEIQWRLQGDLEWLPLVSFDDIRGPIGDQGDQGPPGAGFSYQGSVATVANLPIPSTQGFGFKVLSTGHLHIYNGSAWVDAGPLQGPQGDQGDQGDQGPPGAGFSYRGTLANTALLPTPSTQGYAYRIGTNLWIYNGEASQWDNAGQIQGPPGESGPAGPVAGTPGQAVWNNGGTAAGAPGLLFNSIGQISWAVLSGPMFQGRSTIAASGGNYLLNVELANEFVTAAAISGATTINLSNLGNIPAGLVWSGVLEFAYTSGVISWFASNTGWAIKWDGNTAITPTPGEVETVIIRVVGGSNVIRVFPLKGAT